MASAIHRRSDSRPNTTAIEWPPGWGNSEALLPSRRLARRCNAETQVTPGRIIAKRCWRCKWSSQPRRLAPAGRSPAMSASGWKSHRLHGLTSSLLFWWHARSPDGTPVEIAGIQRPVALAPTGLALPARSGLPPRSKWLRVISPGRGQCV